MAKRFTEANKWNGWFRQLPPIRKLLWLYILDNCDIAGVYRPDKDLAEFSIGSKIEWSSVIDDFEDRIHIFDNGKKWYIKEFIKFQAGDKLNLKSPVHAKIYELLLRYDLAKDFLDENYRLLDRVCNTVCNTGKEKEKEEEEEIEEEEETEEETTVEVSPTFNDFWNEYDKKRGDKDKITAKWKKLSQIDKEAIMEYIPNYKLSEPNKKYRKDPDTFLNNKSWNDEIILDNGSKQSNTNQDKRAKFTNYFTGKTG